MGLREKLKKIVIIGSFATIGTIAGINICNLASFSKGIERIKENPYVGYGAGGNALMCSRNYIIENRDFPENVLTILSRNKAKRTIEEINEYPFSF